MHLFVLPQGCSDTSGFVQAVFGLLLPLGYEYDPSLVVLVRMPDSGVSDSLWQQLTGLLQSFALGHTLVLLQVRVLGKISKRYTRCLQQCSAARQELWRYMVGWM